VECWDELLVDRWDDWEFADICCSFSAFLRFVGGVELPRWSENDGTSSGAMTTVLDLLPRGPDGFSFSTTRRGVGVRVTDS
jgi:hypothetical protein